mmetsp:Transcript_11584/g.11600  ORF Transcript_11584/g.11600 Transcript_11584/m.11600 type:complete len:123 (+) Transcript_11584:97-465(+)
MRLITHNMLKCNIRGVENGYPLIIESALIEEVESEFNPDLVKSMLQKINWNAFRIATQNLGFSCFQEELTDEVKSNEATLQTIHHMLFEVHVLEGFLVCPVTGRKFPIKDGIPNMLLHEDEV